MSDAPSHNNDTSEREGERSTSASSAWMGWTLGLLAVPVVYVLTLPPMVLTALTSAGPTPTMVPKWMQVYAVPYDWLCYHTPVGWMLIRYGEWWDDIYGNPLQLVP